MFAAVIAVSLGGIVIALILAVLVYAIGIYLLHAPQPVVGLIAFLIFVLLVLGNVGGSVTA